MTDFAGGGESRRISSLSRNMLVLLLSGSTFQICRKLYGYRHQNMPRIIYNTWDNTVLKITNPDNQLRDLHLHKDISSHILVHLSL